MVKELRPDLKKGLNVGYGWSIKSYTFFRYYYNGKNQKQTLLFKVTIEKMD